MVHALGGFWRSGRDRFSDVKELKTSGSGKLKDSRLPGKLIRYGTPEAVFGTPERLMTSINTIHSSVDTRDRSDVHLALQDTEF